MIEASSIPVHCAHRELVDVTTLVPNPRNPTKHPDKQIALLAKVIRHQGWRAPITISNRSGFVVTGHGRLEAAKLLQVEKVPVDRQDFATEADEWAHLVADNRLAELAENDDAALKALLDELDKGGLDLELAGFENLDADGVDFTDASSDVIMPGGLGGFEIKSDMRFDSGEPFEIPLLRNDMLASCPEPIVVWCGTDKSETSENYFYNFNTDSVRGLDWKKTVLGFYTQDDRWEKAIWEDTAESVGRFINLGLHSVLSPDWSTYWEWPQAIRLWNTYRNRWNGRHFQECGLRVIPSFNPNPKDVAFCYAGIPTNAPCLAMQMQVGTKKNAEFVELKVAETVRAVGQLVPQSLLVYGNDLGMNALAEKLPKELHVVFIETRSRVRGRKIDDAKVG